MARPVPVLPEVGSTIVPPGRSRPSRSAASISATATRSLIDPPGLNVSSLATRRGRSPAPIRDRRTSGVSPIVSRIESLRIGAAMERGGGGHLSSLMILRRIHKLSKILRKAAVMIGYSSR